MDAKINLNSINNNIREFSDNSNELSNSSQFNQSLNSTNPMSNHVDNNDSNQANLNADNKKKARVIQDFI